MCSLDVYSERRNIEAGIWGVINNEIKVVDGDWKPGMILKCYICNYCIFEFADFNDLHRYVFPGTKKSNDPI